MMVLVVNGLAFQSALSRLLVFSGCAPCLFLGALASGEWPRTAWPREELKAKSFVWSERHSLRPRTAQVLLFNFAV